MVSMIWSPIVKLGLSDVIGSWKIIARRLPRSSRKRSSGASSRSKPSKRIEPVTSAACFDNRPMIAREVTLVSAAGFADQSERRAMSDGKVDAVDGMGDPTIVAMKEDAQTFDFDQRRRCHFCFS